MKILLIFTLCLISDGGDSKEVTGYSGGGVLIKCKYDTEYRENQKFYYLFYEKSISKIVHVGGDLNISCKYPQSLRSDPKFLCKTRLQDSACSYKESVKESRKYVNEGKFSLYDDRETQMMTVSIRNVTEQDSGEYWCGAEAAWTSDDGYKVYFTQIDLTVTDPRVPVSTSIPTQPSSSSSSLSPSSSSLSPSSSSSDSTPASPPAGFPASTVITVSVILLLLLIAISFLFVILQKRQKMQGGTASTGRSSVQTSGNHQGVPPDVCEYEDIKDTRRLPASDVGSSSVYSTAQLPTILSDPQPVYSNTELPTSPCDSILFYSAVYSAVQRPTIPSDRDIYSTAQLPTRLSAEKSDEGLTYAAVSFHSRAPSSNDAVPQILFKKEEVSCDYDTVSHVNS
ncbi:uncharacterized protein LOC128614453 isoform X2 [Ictalurus furcatus]|uniref:uncharacterized protein LOC128614453 isoform X2 n=1 Tax=Ictalurus furcatus TaxID=66913 RepID=UPI00235039C5|nr:uncharacterized protein LOC128614453 isoform X2 [Ictalurus furcatus]